MTENGLFIILSFDIGEFFRHSACGELDSTELAVVSRADFDIRHETGTAAKGHRAVVLVLTQATSLLL